MAQETESQAEADPDAAATDAAEAEPAEAEAATPPPSVDTGDNAWMLVSSALVLMMTAPGLALFYSGLVRKKNVLGVMMQCLFLMGIMSVVWALWGYTLAFGGSDTWIGNMDHLLLKGVQPTFNESTQSVELPMSGTIPTLTHMVFQGMFFIITPGLICGAFAERMKFSAMVLFSVLWGTFVYCPLCHWVWDAGYLAYGANGALLGGALDFAGGTVVHISSGVSALICAVVLGKRLGFGSEPMPPHNLTYTAIGAAMLWVGWFGFNAGSALAAGGLASSAFVATHLSAAAGAVVWPGIEWVLRGKPSVLGTCSGAVAGLVCITPACGYTQPLPSILIGAAAAVVCYFACTTLKHKLGYDDSLDAFGVHGVGGTLGAILTGVFATREVIGTVVPGDDPLGAVYGGSLLLPQIAAVAVTWVLAAVATFILLKVLDLAIGIRVTQQQEIQGLDLSQHGEEGYIFI